MTEARRDRTMRWVLSLACAAWLSACAAPGGSTVPPDGPRNGAGERVDPVTGITLPGVSQSGGGAT